MYEKKNQAAQLLRQISLEHEATARGLTSFSAGGAKHSPIVASLEQLPVCHEQRVYIISTLSRCCKTGLSRVQYNIDVVKRSRKLQVLDAV